MDLLSTLIALLGLAVLFAALIKPLRPLDPGRISGEPAHHAETSTE